MYVYDGSFEGLLCCVFESYEKKEMPVEIKNDCITLYEIKFIALDESKAERVLNGIIKKIGYDALDYIKRAFLTTFADKDLFILRFIKAGFKYGARVFERMTDGDVMPLLKIVKLIDREARCFLQFIRFFEYNGALISIIEPEHNVLPLIAGHFATRLPLERFMIYDKIHGSAAVYSDKELDIIALDGYELPADIEDDEQKYRKLWKMFYDTIEVKERHSELRRMNHLPKKYWKNMTEFSID